MKFIIVSLVAIASVLVFASCASYVNMPNARQMSGDYRSALEALDYLPTDYSKLVDSPSARRDWKATAEATPDLSQLAAVWAFKQSEDIDTGLPTLEKAVVIPGVFWNPPQTLASYEGLDWGAASKDFVSVKKPGSEGYIIAFFRR